MAFVEAERRVFSPLRPNGDVLYSYYVMLVIYLFATYSDGRSASAGPALAIALRPLHCFARAVTNSGFGVIDVIPGKDDPRACSPAPRRLIGLSGDATCLHVNCVNFRRT